MTQWARVVRRMVPGSLAVSASLCLGASSARANPAFPGVLHDELDMPCIPECTVCHQDNDGGIQTLRTATNKAGMTVPGFAQHLESLLLGLDGGDATTLAPVLKQVKAMPPLPDIDGDGVDDLTELSMGSDPNDPSPGASVCKGPIYGCGRIAKPGPVDDVGAVTALTVAMVGVSALRRRRSR